MALIAKRTPPGTRIKYEPYVASKERLATVIGLYSRPTDPSCDWRLEVRFDNGTVASVHQAHCTVVKKR